MAVYRTHGFATCFLELTVLAADSQVYLPYRVDVRPSQEFSYSSASSKLLSLEISSLQKQPVQFLVPHNGLADPDQLGIEDMGFTVQEGKFLHMSSSIDMENVISVGCAGAVLTYLQRRAVSGETSGEGWFRVRYIKMFSLEGTM